MALFSTAAGTVNLTKVKRKSTNNFKDPVYKNYEYPYFWAYKLDGGAANSLDAWEGKDVKWLTSDRQSRNRRWRTAMELIIRNPLQYQDRLMPFEQIKDFYFFTQTLLNFRGHETKWIKGAYYLVRDLSDAYDEWITINFLPNLPNSPRWVMSDYGGLKKLLSELNLKIANYAFTQFNRLLFGDKKTPQKGQDAWEFDKQFIFSEQTSIARLVYLKYANTNALALASAIFNHEGAFSVLNFIGAVINIPVFQDQYDSDMESSPNFGEEARTLIPLAMLYPNRYFYNDIQESSDLNPAIRDKHFAKTLKRGEQKFYKKSYQDRDYQIYRSYLLVNRLIMSTFYR